MNNIGKNPNPIGVNTDLSQQPMQMKEEITGGGTQATLPKNAEGDNKLPLIPPKPTISEAKHKKILKRMPQKNGNTNTPTEPKLPELPKKDFRHVEKFNVTLKEWKQRKVITSNIAEDTPPKDTVEIKSPVWQKIGAGLKSAGKAIGVIALGALAIALLPLTIAGLVITSKADNKVMDIKGEANASFSGEEATDSLASKEKEYYRLIGPNDASKEDLEKAVNLKKEIQKIKKEARPWEILAIVGNVIAFPCTGIGAILK